MKLMKNEIEKFIVSEYKGPLEYHEIFQKIILKYNIKNTSELYVLNKLIHNKIESIINYSKKIQDRKSKLIKLKKLEFIRA